MTGNDIIRRGMVTLKDKIKKIKDILHIVTVHQVY